ncbi:single-stranded DNA-binding protein [Sporosarcina aquimarina]|uniref:Single-stranded DNA-binding protein n=1 Tax=Sporosarcina aquimarina TaxID=114975 RepID=A0ABU4FVB8_9BACL|nr:single-stranded DNA-binding protein [Sporosarcina aquimarina]MDW0108664.1 single-stranded DNA-binding protein [Sporosarcina aquimarina]
MNHVALVGRLTKDPELRMIGERRLQTSFTLAVNRSFKNQLGDIDADFILCTVWGKTAENTVKHCGKGSMIGVSGRIQTRSYEREDKTRAFVTEVVGDDVRFLMTKKPVSSADVGSAAMEHFELPPASSKENETLPIF